MTRTRFTTLLAALICCICVGADAPSHYVNDFEKAADGPVADEYMVLSGAFSVGRFDGNKALELAGEPLDACGLLFGPQGPSAGEVSARIWGKATGRRFPEFALGLNDAGGYKLWVMPAVGKIELRRGDIPRAQAAYRGWKSGAWTRLRLRVAKNGGAWRVEGKAWPDGSPEPSDWMISADEPQTPPAGRPSLWGTPYSGQPIRFDDLAYEPLP